MRHVLLVDILLSIGLSSIIILSYILIVGKDVNSSASTQDVLVIWGSVAVGNILSRILLKPYRDKIRQG